MSDIAVTVVPIFLLIALGFAAARLGLFPAETARGLNLFVFNLAIPALLFRAMVNLDTAATAPWALWGAYFAAAAVVWLAALGLARLVPGLEPAGGSAAGIGAAFGNLVLLGIPLALGHFGARATVYGALIVSVHAPLQWLVATLIAEWAGRGRGRPLAVILRDFVFGLAANPILASLAAGFLWRLAGLPLPEISDRVIALLGQAAVPSALFALGLALAGYSLRGQWTAMGVLVALKLALFPLAAYVMAYHVFALPPLAAAVVVLFAAMPTGANAYLFADRYGAAVAPVSGAIALGTALSVATISAVLWWLGPV